MPSIPPAEVAEMLRWMFWLSFAGMAMAPLAARLFPDQRDRGYVAAKILGWLWISFVPWLASSLGLISFSGSGGAVAVLGSGLLYLAFRRPENVPSWPQVAMVEAGFAALFVLGLATRLDNADLTGLEKFMDLGFLAAAMRADAMPPQDMWLSGHGINYYYFGHAAAAQWALLADVPADHGYQLAMASLFALTGIGIYRLTSEIAGPAGTRLARVAGGTAAALVLYAGNFHAVLYTVFRPWMTSRVSAYHYPDSTRFIGFDPDTADKAFTEFVAYGFRVGDMHAHLLAAPVAVVATLVLLSALRRNWSGVQTSIGHSVVFGWLIGICYMTNAWDVPILGLLALVVALVLLARQPGWQTLDRLGMMTVVMVMAGIATAAPFAAEFDAFIEGIAPARAHSPVWQLLVVYGHGLLPLGLLLPAVALLPDWRGPEQGFAAILAVAVLVLVAIPEIVYVDDIYGEDYARANTMFKLSFRAQMWLQVAAMAAIALFAARSRAQAVLACALAVPVISTLAYAEHTFRPPSRIGSLDGLRFLGTEREVAAFAGALQLGDRGAILEAGGYSFTDAARISAVTGQPGLLGWQSHENLWRSYDPEVDRRHALVQRIYGTADPEAICQAINIYGLAYVILGPIERNLFPGLDEAAIAGIGPTVFRSGDTRVIATDSAACAQ